MLTIISLEDLQKLYKHGKLAQSESFDFLPKSIQDFISDAFKEKTSVEMGKLVHVHRVNGKQVTEVHQELLEDSNDDILAYLPLPDSEPILILTKSDGEMLQFSSDTLNEFSGTSLGSDEEKDFYKELLLEGGTETDACIYAVTTEVKLEDVVAVVYPEELEEKIAQIKQTIKDSKVVFKTTSLFS